MAGRRENQALADRLRIDETDRRPTPSGKLRHYRWPIIGCLGLMLPLLYMVSYLLLMEPRVGVVFGTGPWSKHPHYRLGGPVAEWFYAPLHAMDIRVRPEYWEVWPTY
jgi:hypothetical protein